MSTDVEFVLRPATDDDREALRLLAEHLAVRINEIGTARDPVVTMAGDELTVWFSFLAVGDPIADAIAAWMIMDLASQGVARAGVRVEVRAPIAA